MNLLPCPHCGGEPSIQNVQAGGSTHERGVYVECGGCGAMTAMHLGRGPEAGIESAAAWNTRKPYLPAKVAAHVLKTADLDNKDKGADPNDPDSDFDPMDASGGSFDGAYSLGVDNGERGFARWLIHALI